MAMKGTSDEYYKAYWRDSFSDHVYRGRDLAVMYCGGEEADSRGFPEG